MFTGIIEQTGVILSATPEGQNVHFTISCDLAGELKVDQSVAHDGVCLTVVEVHEQTYVVTAIGETLRKTSLAQWAPGRRVNIERSVRAGDRLDGHMVQGHVDFTGICRSIEEADGSWLFDFSHEGHDELFTVPRGSIAVNGVSLTVVDGSKTGFRVAIIPYTFEHTTFQYLKPGDAVNLEFDILGKYLTRYLRSMIPSRLNSL